MEQTNSRYARHYSLKDFGAEGQRKLTEAKVLVIGAGGLGCPTLLYLAAAGVGSIGIVDDDHVSLSNLQRQVLFGTNDIGRPKASTAAEKLSAMNDEIAVVAHTLRITTDNALELIANYDIIVDCTDNFSSRYLINDACALMNKPLVFGAIFQYEGQVAIFNLSDKNNVKTNYRHLFSTPPDPLEVADCNEAGVLGVLPGIIGGMQAAEVIKLLVGIGDPLINRLLTFSLLTYDSYIIDIDANSSINAMIPTDESEFKAINYEWFCGNSALGITELNSIELLESVAQPDTILIDVREVGEMPLLDLPHVSFPFTKLVKQLPNIKPYHIILLCQSGKRSLKIAQLMNDKYGSSKKISHLKGGMLRWNEEEGTRSKDERQGG